MGCAVRHGVPSLLGHRTALTRPTRVIPEGGADMENTMTVAVHGTRVRKLAVPAFWRVQRPFAFVALGGIPTDNSTRVSAAGGP